MEEDGTLQEWIEVQEWRKVHGKFKDMRKTRTAKVHELSAQASVVPWIQQLYAAPYQQIYQLV